MVSSLLMRGFIFVCGLILGVFGLLTAQNLGYLRLDRMGDPPPRRAVPAATLEGAGAGESGPEAEASVERLRGDLEAQLAEPQGKNLDALAVLLEEAIFDRSWEKVQVAADAVRAHGAEWVAPPVAPPPAPPEERSIFELEKELRRRHEERGFALRRNRATALLRSRDPRAPERLLEILRTSTDALERLDAAWVLARSGDERSIEELTRMLSSTSTELRAAAGQALAREGYLAALRELTTVARRAPESEVRAHSLATLASFSIVQIGESPVATQALVSALREDDIEEVRAAAAAALGEMDIARVPAYVTSLVECLERESSEAVRTAALRSLSRAIGETGPLPVVLRAFERELASERARQNTKEILDFLGHHGDRETLAALEAFAASPQTRGIEPALTRARDELRARLAAAPPR